MIERVEPGVLEQGREYRLVLRGKNLTPLTAITLGEDIAMLGTANVSSATRATLRVFVPPTAKAGPRQARAENENGSSSGPGVVSVRPPASGKDEKK